LGSATDSRPGRVLQPGSRPALQPRVARTWGRLQAHAQLRGRPRPVNDTWIAARCLVHDLPLATLNIKDYEDFSDHEQLRLIR
jgi:hypothetical protein